MRSLLGPRRLASFVGLTAVWCALWGDVSIGTVLAGCVVSALVTALGVGTDGRGGVRPAQLARLVGVVAVDLVRSTIAVATEVVTPVDRTNEAVIAVDLDVPEATRHHLLLLTVAVTVTPGTAVVDVDQSRNRLYLHLLHDENRAAIVEHVQQLALLATEALPAERPTGGAAS